MAKAVAKVVARAVTVIGGGGSGSGIGSWDGSGGGRW